MHNASKNKAVMDNFHLFHNYYSLKKSVQSLSGLDIRQSSSTLNFSLNTSFRICSTLLKSFLYYLQMRSSLSKPISYLSSNSDFVIFLKKYELPISEFSLIVVSIIFK